MNNELRGGSTLYAVYAQRTGLIVLTITALLKLAALLHNVPLMGIDDPVLGIAYRKVLVIAAAVELIAALGISAAGPSRSSGWLLLTLVSTFALYRVALHIVAPAAFCPCLGNLMQIVGLSNAATDRVSVGVLSALALAAVAMCVFGTRTMCTGPLSRQLS